MADEIERKFLVTDPDWASKAKPASASELDQGYLCADAGRAVRVRIDGERAFLTVKGPTEGITRAEFEYAIPPADAKAMLALCDEARITKRRHIVHHAGRTWEVDEFRGANAGLVLAEIELDAADEIVELPAWVGEEVSDRPEYLNANLAKRPVSEWG